MRKNNWKLPVLVLLTMAAVFANSGQTKIRGEEREIVLHEIQVTPTIHSVGIYWPIEGDEKGKATATVEYRAAGSENWKTAFPLRRVVPRQVDFTNNTVDGLTVWFAGGFNKWSGFKTYAIKSWAKNYLAGSIMNLEPATKYEIRITLKVPGRDDSVQTVTATTRAIPVLPTNGKRIEVHGGGSALEEAMRKAQPGNIFVVHEGIYAPFTVYGSGTAAQPIVVQTAGDGEVVIQGDAKTAVTINGSHVFIHGLTIKDFSGVGLKVSPQTTDVSITRCKFIGCYTSLRGGGKNGYYADNTIRGIKEPNAQGDHTEGHGIEIFRGTGGQGTVICYNTISHVADAIRVHCSEADVYGNDASHCSDDALETDDGGPNLRIWGNRFSYTGHNGLSFQPYIGGPAYVIGNLIVNDSEYTIKDRYKASGGVFINNTFVALGLHEDACTPIPERSFARNNLFVTTSRDAMRFHPEDVLDPPIKFDFDFNGYAGLITGQGWHIFKRSDMRAMTLDAFRALTEQEKNGLTLKAEDCFVQALPTPEAIKQRHQTWVAPHPDLALKQNAPAIDKGTVIPNLAEKFSGAAPDLGALEFGAPLPHWGVRP